jgi:CTP synthase (UTP-ammonia lyase)
MTEVDLVRERRRKQPRRKQPLRIGIVGDFDPGSPYHKATTDALGHAAGVLSVALDCSWVPTQSLDEASGETALRQFDALWCAPGSPYKSMNGALSAIRFAREKDLPFLGT